MSEGHWHGEVALLMGEGHWHCEVALLMSEGGYGIVRWL